MGVGWLSVPAGGRSEKRVLCAKSDFLRRVSLDQIETRSIYLRLSICLVSILGCGLGNGECRGDIEVSGASFHQRLHFTKRGVIDQGGTP